ncbi:MAG: hypothetical protein PF961_02965 [Planctomycetota bacterium]|jgi:hypothetical protein|nr:hypothetical protein [Planctomycetota bacterium]
MDVTYRLMVLLGACVLTTPAAESRLRSAGDEVHGASTTETTNANTQVAEPSTASVSAEPDQAQGNTAGSDFSASSGDLLADSVVGLFGIARAFSMPAYYRYPYDYLDPRPDGPQVDTTADPDVQAAQLEVFAQALPRPWNGHFAGLAGADEDLYWYGFDGRVVSPIGLGLSAQWLRYIEDLDNETVRADLSDISLVWRAFELPYGTFDATVGWLGFHDEIGTENGAQFGLDLVVLPMRPLVVQASSSWGAVGDATVQRYHLGAGATWRNLSATAGYRWTDIGDVDLDGFELQIRFWY